MTRQHAGGVFLNDHVIVIAHQILFELTQRFDHLYAAHAANHANVSELIHVASCGCLGWAGAELIHHPGAYQHP